MQSLYVSQLLPTGTQDEVSQSHSEEQVVCGVVWIKTDLWKVASLTLIGQADTAVMVNMVGWAVWSTGECWLSKGNLCFKQKV